ncbi:specifically androgen-regulated gene protein-like [Boleophthalmus pectinirostris]|uniref:specifically androgen-regulated gene protein-like n=1 Tax=Boleophthalmus pectinirostris TaxID=150288 RepID=UPI00243166D9|nr:specifically androgen-regulated gene protein-like [Boleophthalmus pectinirostris]
MPNSDTWPRGVSVETISNMDTARSCDSVISINSACSEDSMEHLSAEEKACLMYLEETIESLDLQEDSGFSNDEPDPANLRRKHGGSETLPEPSNLLSMLVERCRTEASGESANPDPQTSALDLSEVPDHIPPDPVRALSEPTSGSTTPVPAPHSSELSLSADVDPQSGAAKAELFAKPPGEMDLAFIPPPSDFMDEPESPTSPQMDSAVSSPVSKPTIMLEVLRQRVSAKSTSSSAPSSPTPLRSTPETPAPISPSSVSPVPVSPASPSSSSPSLASPSLAFPSLSSPSLSSPSPASPSLSSPSLASPILASPSFTPLEKPLELSSAPSSHPSSPQTLAPPGPSEPKSPPAVAPKPKKLPPNIILKSHKSTGHESSVGHLSPSTTGLMDPQKVRMEALRKLGLLKSEEYDSVPAHKSVQTRRSWASSPLSPTSPKSASPVPSVHTLVPAQTPSPHIPSEPLPDIIPVPTAFSDDAFAGDSPLLNKKLLCSAGGGVKSATLERSGMGLSSYMESLEHDKQTLGQLRNNRPRPASLGSKKDFSGAGGVAIAGGVASTEVGSGKPGPSSSQHSDNSQKLPRSQGISVLICPRGQSEEARREALKKLGLLRD